MSSKDRHYLDNHQYTCGPQGRNLRINKDIKHVRKQCAAVRKQIQSSSTEKAKLNFAHPLLTERPSVEKSMETHRKVTS
jgi:hypothetical protein